MTLTVSAFNQAVDHVPYINQVSRVYRHTLAKKFATKDPFYELIPKKSATELKPGEQMTFKRQRRRAPENITSEQRRLWKQIIQRAWFYDRNFCGIMGFDLGCGLISIVSIIPLIGSAIAYYLHYQQIKLCYQAGAPAKLQAEMVANIGLDFLLTLVPLLGILLSWLQSSSTRNAALFDTWLRAQSRAVEKGIEIEEKAEGIEFGARRRNQVLEDVTTRVSTEYK